MSIISLTPKGLAKSILPFPEPRKKGNVKIKGAGGVRAVSTNCGRQSRRRESGMLKKDTKTTTSL